MNYLKYKDHYYSERYHSMSGRYEPCTLCAEFREYRHLLKNKNNFTLCTNCNKWGCGNYRGGICCRCASFNRSSIGDDTKSSFEMNRRYDFCYLCTDQYGLSEKEGRLTMILFYNLNQHRCGKYTLYCYECDILATMKLSMGYFKDIDKNVNKKLNTLTEQVVSDNKKEKTKLKRQFTIKAKKTKKELLAEFSKERIQLESKIKALSDRLRIVDFDTNLLKSKDELLMGKLSRSI